MSGGRVRSNSIGKSREIEMELIEIEVDFLAGGTVVTDMPDRFQSVVEKNLRISGGPAADAFVSGRETREGAILIPLSLNQRRGLGRAGIRWNREKRC